MTETYTFTLVRKHKDGSEEVITTEFPTGEDYTTHMVLATQFNRFLDSCGYVGHNYVNDRDAKRNR